jgi:hypothetical protein
VWQVTRGGRPPIEIQTGAGLTKCGLDLARDFERPRKELRLPSSPMKSGVYIQLVLARDKAKRSGVFGDQKMMVRCNARLTNE